VFCVENVHTCFAFKKKVTLFGNGIVEKTKFLNSITLFGTGSANHCDRKTEKNIEVYVMKWSELIEQNKRKLGYLSNQLEVKDKSVKDKFEQEYSELIDEKISAQLRAVKKT